MLRITALILILVAGVAVILVGRTGDEPVQRVETPELRPAPDLAEVAGTPASTPQAERPQPEEAADEPGEIRIGSFERPENVPKYEILEEERADRDGVRAVRLLVDTPARSEADLELIARDIKARYAEYDAVSVEFTDTTSTLSYNGGALIFNTPDGADYIGYIYGPPNTEGYYARAAE